MANPDRTDDPIGHVLRGSTRTPPPVWLMRQAGRYLPEYRALRAEAGSFLDLCYDPDKASEVTLQPIRRFGMDAAVLFSDILVIPHALGRNLAFVEGEGPRLDPVDSAAIGSLVADGDMARLDPVYETVRQVRASLEPDKSLIGFCGAPWTVATYMIAGKGTPDQAPARLFSEREPEAFQELIDKLVEASATYLIGQAKAGADALQIFDSWVSVLGEDAFRMWSIEPTRRLIDKVRAAVPDVPIIGFPKGAGLLLESYAEATGVDGLGIDWTVPLSHARDRLQPRVAVQGNLDPLTLMVGGDPMRRAVRGILDTLGDGRLIFNLGHGIRPQTPVEHVAEVVAMVHAHDGGAARKDA